MWKGLTGISWMKKRPGQGGQEQPLKEPPVSSGHTAHTQEVLNQRLWNCPPTNDSISSCQLRLGGRVQAADDCQKLRVVYLVGK